MEPRAQYSVIYRQWTYIVRKYKKSFRNR